MRDQSLTRLASRSAAVFMIGWGCQTLLGMWIEALNGSHMPADKALRWGLVMVAVGLLFLVLPWERWHPRATIVIGLIIVPVVSAVAWDTQFAAGRDTPSPDSAFFIVLAWVGVTQRQWAPTLFAPYIGALYGGALLLTPGTRESTGSMLTVIVLAAMLGELIAWMQTTVLRAQLMERQRLHDVEALTGTLSRLRGVGLDDAATTVGQAVMNTFRCDDVTVVLHLGSDPTVATYGNGERVGLDAASALLARADPSIEGRVAFVEGATAAAPVAASGGGPRVRITLTGPGDVVTGIVEMGLVEPPDDFTLHLARLFATEVGTAVQQVEQVDALEQKALFDELTGVGNRRWAVELLTGLRPGDAVMLIDVDEFKTINDTRGHASGDEVLRALGRHVRMSMPDAEAVARYGGDEFLVVNRVEDGDPVERARQMHEAWAALGADATISIGVAVHPGGEPPEVTLEHADVALYRSKQSGRNRVELY